VFPHHENELAQSTCAFHADRMANVWMHNGFLQVESEKMSKSLGNFITIRESLADWPGEVLRLNMLKTHYRSPIDWTTKGLEESAKTLDDWYEIAGDVKADRPSDGVIDALSDDLNTPQMIAALHGLRNAASGNEQARGQFAATLRLLDSPKPVIAQVHGYALAGGLELAMACDLIVAAEGTQLGEPEIRYGSAPVTLLMPYLIGQKKTRELLFTGDLIDAAEAERIGLVNRVVPADRLAAEVDGLADRLARTPPEVMGLTKRMLNRAMDAAGFREAVEAGIDLGAIINAADTPEQREWDTIVRRDGLRAALAWRDRRYDERLADRGRGA